MGQRLTVKRCDIEARLTQAMQPSTQQEASSVADDFTSDRDDPYREFGDLQSGPDDVDLDWGPK